MTHGAPIFHSDWALLTIKLRMRHADETYVKSGPLSAERSEIAVTNTRAGAIGRVVMLLVALVVVLSVVGLGTVGVGQMRSDFDQLVEEDFPRFDALLHTDRDLFRAQRALESGLLSDNPTIRAEHLGEYHNQVDRTASRWASYIAVSAGDRQELEWQASHESARTSWLASSAALAAAIDGGAGVQTAGVDVLLATAQSDFNDLRNLVHDLEEEIAEPLIAESTIAVTASADRTILQLFLLLASVGLLAAGAIAYSGYRVSRTRQARAHALEGQRAADAARAAFESELSHALDMAQHEDEAIETVELALAFEVPERGTELLLADTSHAHLKQVALTDWGCVGAGCTVSEPNDCPAIRRGAPLTFLRSDAYSACTHLRARDGEADSAVCVPVSVAGRMVGVMHSAGPVDEPAAPEDLYKLEQVANRAGSRLGILRAFAQSQTQASTDPLTGLLNRRSFENEAREKVNTGTTAAIGYADLDNFKLLNDRHGHDTGDRALRLFARVLRNSLRDGDLAARWGGEEFVLLFSGSDTTSAAVALQRLKENLLVALAGANIPPFTASFGLADSTMTVELDELVALADDSLMEAKRRGRDGVVVAGTWESSPSPAPAEESESELVVAGE